MRVFSFLGGRADLSHSSWTPGVTYFSAAPQCPPERCARLSWPGVTPSFALRACSQRARKARHSTVSVGQKTHDEASELSEDLYSSDREEFEMPKERTTRKRGHKSEAREHRADPLAEGLELPNHPNFD